MRHSILSLWALVTPLLVAPAVPAAGESTEGGLLAAARVEASQFRFNEALETFRRAERAGEDAREARLGQALALLNAQPLKQSNVASATRLLDELIANPGPGDLLVTARYFRARIAHLHQSRDDPADAAARYAALFRDHPEHLLAQQAVVKLARLRLFDANDSRPRSEVLEEIDELAGGLSYPPARRDLHLLLGDAAQFFDLPPETALRHFLAAKSAGIEGHGTRGNLLIAIAGLAGEIGDHGLTASHYREFLDKHGRDNRAFTVRQRLAQLEGRADPEREDSDHE